MTRDLSRGREPPRQVLKAVPFLGAPGAAPPLLPVGGHQAATSTPQAGSRVRWTQAAP